MSLQGSGNECLKPGAKYVSERLDSILVQDQVAASQEIDVRSGGDQDYAMDSPRKLCLDLKDTRG